MDAPTPTGSTVLAIQAPEGTELSADCVSEQTKTFENQPLILMLMYNFYFPTARSVSHALTQFCWSHQCSGVESRQGTLVTHTYQMPPPTLLTLYTR